MNTKKRPQRIECCPGVLWQHREPRQHNVDPRSSDRVDSSDAELLVAWAQQDVAAGEALFERYYPAMLRFFSNKVSGDPSDLIQDTFMACLGARERLRKHENFRSFLFGIAYNKLRNHYRKGRTEGERLDFGSVSAADLSPGATTMLAQGAEQRLLLQALRSIPVEHQVVLEMFYWESMTSATIANVLDEAHGTVRTRIRRARQLLEDALRRVSTDPSLAQRTSSDLDGWAASIRAHHGTSH